VALVSASFFTGPLAIIDAMSLCFPLLTIGNVLCLGIFAMQLRRFQRSLDKARAAQFTPG